MVKSPPCCVTLEKATKIIAIIEIVLTSLALLVLTVSLVVVSLNYSSTNVPSALTLPSSTLNIFGLENFKALKVQTDDFGVISKNNLTIVYDNKTFYSDKYVVSQAVNQAMGVIIICLSIATVLLVLHVQLLMGAVQRNYWRCMVWFQVQVVQTIISFVLTMFVLFVMIPETHWGLWLGLVVQLGLVFYIMWIIFAFIKELELELEVNGNVGVHEAFISKT